MGTESHDNGRYQSDERKHDAVHHPRIRTAVPVEKRFPVISQRDGYYGKVGADGEHREQAQEIAQKWNAQNVAVICEVQRVHVTQQRVVETEYSCEGEQGVEAQNQDVVGDDQGAHPPFVGDGRHERGQRVLAHERVDADPEEVGHTCDLCHGWVAFAVALANTNQCQDNHHGEC